MVNPRYITEAHNCEFHSKPSHSWQVTDSAENKVIKGLVHVCTQCGRQWKTVTVIEDLKSDDNWLDDRFLNSP